MEREGWIRRHDRKEKESRAPPPTHWNARKNEGKFHVARNAGVTSEAEAVGSAPILDRAAVGSTRV